MLFFLNLDGTVARDATERVFQGQNDVTSVDLITAITPDQTGIQVAFTLPNGLATQYMSMTQCGKYSLLRKNDGEQIYKWTYKLPFNVTKEKGKVGVSFNIIKRSGSNAQIVNQTTYTSEFTVEYSALPTPPASVTESEINELINLLTLNINNLESRVAALEAKG